MNIVVGFARILGRSIGIIANQPSVLAGAHRHQRRPTRPPLHPLLQRLQHPAGHLRRRAGLPARRAAGVRRHHPPRRQDAVRLLGGHRAEDQGDPPQVLRRGAPGDVLARTSAPTASLPGPPPRSPSWGPRGPSRSSSARKCRRPPDKAARRAELIEQYRATFSTPYVAAGRRLVDDIIEPANTRKHLAQALEYLQTKRDHRPPKKHGLIPL